MPDTGRSSRSSPNRWCVAVGAAVLAGLSASLAAAARGPQLVLVRAAALDDGAGLEERANAMLVKGSKYFVAGYRSGESNGRNASFGTCTAKLAWDGGYTMDGWAHLDDEYDDAATGPHGEVYAVGYSNQVGRGRDIFVQKFMKNLKGTLESSYVDSTGGDDAAHGVAVAKDGTVFVVGETTVPRAPVHVWLGRYDADLGLVTQATYGGPLGDARTGRAIAIDADGNLIVAGSIARAGTGADLWVGKFSPDLRLLGEVYADGDGTGDDVAYGVVIDKKRRIWVAGSVTIAGRGAETWLGGFDADLAMIGAAVGLGSTTGDDAARAVVTDNRGHLFVAGRKSHANGGFVPWVAVFDTHLDLLTETTYATPETTATGRSDDHDGARHVVLLPGSTVLVVGGVTTAPTGGDQWLATYKASRLPVVKKP